MKPSSNRTKLLRAFITTVLALAVVLVGVWLYGAYRWNVGTKELRARLDAARVPVRPQTVDFRDLEGLPAPVQRYFRAVLEDEQPMVAGAADALLEPKAISSRNARRPYALVPCFACASGTVIGTNHQEV